MPNATKMSNCIIPMNFDVLSPKGVKESALVERSGHRIAVDDRYLYCWGGYNPEFWATDNDDFTVYPLLRELWRYNRWTHEWQKLQTLGDVPTELASHNVLKVQNHLLHFGGTGLPFGEACSNCLYDLNLDTLQWRRLVHVSSDEDKNVPSPKYGHAMVKVDKYIYIVGGTSGFIYDMDVHRLDLQHLKWEALEPTGRYVPDPRYRHEVVYHEGKLYLFGGGTALAAFEFENIDVFDIKDRCWTSVKTQPYLEAVAKDAYPTGRRCHSCSKFGDYMYMCGGLSTPPDSIKRNIWKLHLSTLQWTQLQQTLPIPVYFHSTAISQDGCMYVFGGVTRVDDQRTNKLQIMWLNVPSLKTLSWTKILKQIELKYARDNWQQLLNLGVPKDLIETIL